MSSKIKIAKIEAVAKKQDENGQFTIGDEEQQYAARFIEMFVGKFTDITAHATSEDLEEYTAAALNALRDLQVRDYLLGLINGDNITTVMVALDHMMESAPKKYISAPASLLALTYYETGQTERALNTLAKAKEDYPLASLLNRVFTAGWPAESFQQMRQELHPKVVAGIFGEDN
jgi:hypothetical protein